MGIKIIHGDPGLGAVAGAAFGLAQGFQKQAAQREKDLLASQRTQALIDQATHETELAKLQLEQRQQQIQIAESVAAITVAQADPRMRGGLGPLREGNTLVTQSPFGKLDFQDTATPGEMEAYERAGSDMERAAIYEASKRRAGTDQFNAELMKVQERAMRLEAAGYLDQGSAQKWTQRAQEVGPRQAFSEMEAEAGAKMEAASLESFKTRLAENLHPPDPSGLYMENADAYDKMYAEFELANTPQEAQRIAFQLDLIADGKQDIAREWAAQEVARAMQQAQVPGMGQLEGVPLAPGAQPQPAGIGAQRRPTVNFSDMDEATQQQLIEDAKGRALRGEPMDFGDVILNEADHKRILQETKPAIDEFRKREWKEQTKSPAEKMGEFVSEALEAAPKIWKSVKDWWADKGESINEGEKLATLVGEGPANINLARVETIPGVDQDAEADLLYDAYLSSQGRHPGNKLDVSDWAVKSGYASRRIKALLKESEKEKAAKSEAEDVEAREALGMGPPGKKKPPE